MIKRAVTTDETKNSVALTTPDQQRTQSGLMHRIVVAVGLSLMAGCMTAPVAPQQTALQIALEAVHHEGIGLMVDGCILRSTAIGEPDFYAEAESHTFALRLGSDVRASLQSQSVTLLGYAEPFVCGILSDRLERHDDTRIAADFDASPHQARMPQGRFAATAVDTPRGQALFDVFHQAAVYTELPTWGYTLSQAAPSSRQIVSALLHARYVIVASGEGIKITSGHAAETVALALVGGLLGGASVGQEDDTTLRLALLDLQTGECLWENRMKYVTNGNGINPIRQDSISEENSVATLIAPMWNAKVAVAFSAH